MDELGVDVLLLSVGADLPYLTGYEAMPLERLTMLVLPRDGDARLVVPELEAPRVVAHPGVFELRAWSETEDPIAIVAELVGPVAATGRDRRPHLGALRAEPAGRTPRRAVPPGVGGHGTVADREGPRRDRRARGPRRTRSMRWVRRCDGSPSPAAPSWMCTASSRIGSSSTATSGSNFAIVGSGPNGASPHHEAAARVIGDGDVVVCDFGGTMDGYCSDITRMYVVGEPSAEVRDVYALLVDAQEQAVRAATVGTSCEDVDATARRVIAAGGLGDRFIHRTGHGIGLEAHEEPYLVSGNREPLEPGHAFSIEPGIYFPGRFGMRLEDIVVAASDGPDRLNAAPRDLAIVG